jgi:hypothetical protein
VTTFHDYAAAGFRDDLLPILPVDAGVHPNSLHLMTSRGKVPGRKRPEGWAGFKYWTRHVTTDADIPMWQGWGAGIGMQGRRFPALDVDIDDPELADAVHREALAVLGAAPARFGRGPRRILVYAGAGMRKERLAFRRLGETDGAAQAVEFLATGQQYVVEGIHPGTREPYVWQHDHSPVELGPDGLTSITAEQLRTLYLRIEGLLELHGYEVVTRSGLAGVRGAGPVSNGGLRAPSVAAIGRALAAIPNEVDYDTWLKIGAAVKASAAPEEDQEALALWEDWSLQYGGNTPEMVLVKWDSLRPPFKVGWDFLSHYATEEGDGTFHGAWEDFDAIEQPPAPGKESKGPPVSSKVQAVFDRYVWVERLRRMCDRETGDLLDREQFNVRNAHIGPPTSSTGSAWSILTSNPRRLTVVKAVTFRPGRETFVTEDLPGLVGLCINRWRDPAPALPESATDADVRTWLNHVALVVPDERERGIVLDWLGWIIQNPGEKPNWALVIGSTSEGIGKDMMVEPVRVALGAGNVREIGPDDLVSGYTDFIANTRLLLVEEMQMSERKAMMNRLKPLVAAPPYTLRVNVKFEPQYEVPNIVASIFFTNMEAALSLSQQDRRYFVTWNHGEPREPSYYEALANWYDGGGAALAARWLLSRDVSAFKAKGRAPDTAAKGAMRLAALPDLEATIHDGLVNREGPFARRLVTVGEVAEWVREFIGPFRVPSPRRLVGALKAAGAIQFDRRPSLGPVPAECRRPHAYDPKQVQLFAMPGDVAALELLDDLPALREGFWAERLSVHEDFAADEMIGGVK